MILIVLIFAIAFTNTAISQEDNQQSSEKKVADPPVKEEAPAKEEPAEQGAENSPAKDEINDELNDAISKAFIYLKSHQNSDGSFGRGRYGRHVGITSLCALAFMSDGNLPGRGEYGDQVSKALEFVLEIGK